MASRHCRFASAACHARRRQFHGYVVFQLPPRARRALRLRDDATIYMMMLDAAAIAAVALA